MLSMSASAEEVYPSKSLSPVQLAPPPTPGACGGGGGKNADWRYPPPPRRRWSYPRPKLPLYATGDEPNSAVLRRSEDLEGPASSALVGVAVAPGASAGAAAGAGGAGEEALFASRWYPLGLLAAEELMLLPVLVLSFILSVEAAFGVLQPLSLPPLEPPRSSGSVAGMAAALREGHRTNLSAVHS